MILSSILGTKVSDCLGLRALTEMLTGRYSTLRAHEIKHETPEDEAEYIMPFPVQVMPHSTAVIRYELVWLWEEAELEGTVKDVAMSLLCISYCEY